MSEAAVFAEAIQLLDKTGFKETSCIEIDELDSKWVSLPKFHQLQHSVQPPVTRGFF